MISELIGGAEGLYFLIKNDTDTDMMIILVTFPSRGCADDVDNN